MEHELLNKYLSGNASEKEKEQVMTWVNADDANQTALRAMRRLYDITLWQITEGKKQRSTKKAVLYRVVSVAAVFLLVLGSGLYITHLQRQLPDTIMQTIRVPAGQRVELTLTDGTNVWLNAGSTFTFPNNFSSEKREVLLDGEGYFQVKKNNKKPFVVNTSSYGIRVLGTEFNVMAYDKSSLFDVSLLSGSVEVFSDVTHEKIQLQPNKRVYKKNDKLETEPIEHFDHLLWKEGIISFDDEPVDSMVSQLELYFDIRIFIQNEAFKKKRYTGKFRTKDGVEHILKVFQLKDKFNYIKEDETNTIIIK
jgi:Fe2+-dicitrate sensor, membrane component